MKWRAMSQEGNEGEEDDDEAERRPLRSVASKKTERPVLGAFRPREALNGPQDRQKDEKQALGKLSRPPGTPRTAHRKNWSARMSGAAAAGPRASPRGPLGRSPTQGQ